jgi:Zn-dependent metalloprotease
MSVRRQAAWISAAAVVMSAAGCVAEPVMRPLAASASVPAPVVSKPSRTTAAGEATRLLAKAPAVVRGSDRERYTVRDVAVDGNGSRHVRVDRTYRGLPVLGGDAVVHTGPDGQPAGATVAQDRRIDVGVRPAVNARRAEAAAIRAYPGNRRDSPARLVVDALDGRPVLAWEVGLTGYAVVVDAQSGQIRRGVPVVHTAEPGTGHGLHSGEVPMSTRLAAGGGYELIDPQRGNSTTRDALDQWYPQIAETTVLTDADNVWGDGTMAERATVAADVHYGVQQTWDYFEQRHGRNGIDDDGKGAVALTHHGENSANASWSDTCKCMSFGDGNATSKAFTSLDLVGHEMAHGITSATAGLAYWNESGGLNEATSDIFGTLVEFAAQNPADPPDYLVGEKTGTPLRSMADPAADGKSRSCWTPDLGDLDVHYSSGVANKFFFMLAEGSGTSAYGTSPTCGGAPEVTGIGRDAAGAIWYRALTRYLVSNSNYAAARQATLRAATDLHGAGSPQYASVEAAWDAVGVDAGRALPQAPAVRALGDLKGVVGQEVRVQVEATDAQGDELTYSVTGLPDGLTMTGGGLITGVPTREYGYFTLVTVTDAAGNASEVYTTWEINGPPVFYPEQIKPRVSKLGERLFDYVSARDVNHPLTYEFTGLPDGLVQQDPGGVYISGRPTALGVWQVTATVTDATGMSTSITIPWTVVAEVPTSVPTRLAATRSGTDITVTWDLPYSSNYATITHWEVTAEPGGHRVTVQDWFRWSAVLPSLDPATAYEISVVAVNAGGRSPAATITVPRSSASS